MSEKIGLGCGSALLNVYIANRPNLPAYRTLTNVMPLSTGEIGAIGQELGNGWRKVFNVYSKLVFSFNQAPLKELKWGETWQAFRDQHLLQHHSNSNLLFSPPLLDQRSYHVVMGRTYAKDLVSKGLLNAPLKWLDNEFAVNQEEKLVVCPYFDYRQLSDIKIARLNTLLSTF